MGKTKKAKKIIPIPERVETLEKAIKRLGDDLRDHIAEPYGTILVKEKNGEWGDWTGVFRASNEEKVEVIKTKILEHYNRYFKDNNSELTLGLFINDGNKTKFVENLN